MKRFVFIDSEGNINSIVGWGDERDLPANYPIPDGCIVQMTTDDDVDLGYKYDSSTDSFIQDNISE